MKQRRCERNAQKAREDMKGKNEKQKRQKEKKGKKRETGRK